MRVDPWAFDGPFYLALPPRAEAVGLMFLSLTAALLLASQAGGSWRNARLDARRRWWLAALLVSAPLAAQLLVIRLPGMGPASTPGVPLAAGQIQFPLLGGVAWILAAGIFGGWPAIAVAFVAGLARAGWGTHSALTPLDLGLQAAVVAWLLRQNYRETPADLMRRPLAAALFGGLVFALLRSFEIFVHSQANWFDALDFTAVMLPPILAAALGEAAVAGLAAVSIKRAYPGIWVQSEQLVAAPFNRSLTARMVSAVLGLGLLGAVLLASGQYLLARSAVRALVEDQMVQTATQASGGIPFFIQHTRAAIREEAASIRLPEDSEGLDEQLADALRRQPLFERLAVFGPGGEYLGSTWGDEPGLAPISLGEEAAIAVALQGVPQEAISPPAEQGRGAQMMFVAPIRSGEAGEIRGAAAGWTSLDENPLLNPVFTLMSERAIGEAFVVDDRGIILFHPDGRGVMGTSEAALSRVGQVVQGPAPDGTSRLEYVHPVPGYAWHVVIFVPQRVIEQMAMPIAARLLAVLLVVGGALLIVVYWTSRRLTRPLGLMTSLAESIARGSLEHPVPIESEDEVGRLAAAFEHMRRALKTRLQETQLLLDVSRRLASGLELASSLQPILEGLRAMTGAEVVRLTWTDTLASLAEAPAGLEASSTEAAWSVIDAQIVDLCRERGHFALENPSRARAVLDVARVGRPLEALAAFPIHHEGDFVGALWLAYDHRHPFSPEEESLFSILGAQIGVWLTNVSLYYQAQAERRRLAAVLETTPDAVIMVDGKGIVSLANPAAEMVLHGSHEAARGRPAADVVASDGIVRLLSPEAGEEHSAEVTVEDGRVLSAQVKDIEASAGAPSGRVLVLWDITHYKKLDMLKSEFVSTVSHDLRAPLTLMRGYATMITMVGAVSGQQREFVSKILDTVEQMSSLVENLLDLGRIEAGLGLHLEETRIGSVIEEVVEAFRPNAVNKRIALNVALEEPLEPLQADATLLRQAIANLADNAIKFTPAGGNVTLRAWQESGRTHIAVEDSGLGIAPTDQARLFEKFYRARRKETLKEKGSGLGLAIVKSIVEQHGGRVGVRSRLGEGSTFSLDIPITADT